MGNPLPQEVPEDGIYDCRIKNFGYNSDDENMLHLIIDNGEYQGKAISGMLSDREVAEFSSLTGLNLHTVAQDHWRSVQTRALRVRVEVEAQIVAEMVEGGFEMWSDLDERDGVKQFHIRYSVCCPVEPEAPSEIDEWLRRSIAEGRDLSGGSYDLNAEVEVDAEEFAGAGLLPPRDYQEQTLVNTREHYDEGTNRLMWALATGLGKGQPLDAEVHTPEGPRKMGSLAVGDEVIGSDGTPTKVDGVFDRGVLPTYMVELDDGQRIEVDGDHLWAVRSRSQKCRGKGYSVKETRDLEGENLDDLYIPLVEPVQYDEHDLPLDPYVLGLLIGDGGFTSGGVMFSSADAELVAEIEKRTGASLRHRGKYDYYVQGGGVLEAIQELGLDNHDSHSKFIPEQYQYASVEQRLALLRGLMDTDGTRRADGGAGFCSVSRPLIEGVRDLTRSLGGKTKIRSRTTNGGCGYAYRLTVNTPDCPFRLERKGANWKSENRSRTRKIVAVCKFGRAPIRCISVEAEDSLYVTEGYTVTHNTTIASHLPQRFPELCAYSGDDGGLLFLSHRIEIIQQAYARFQEAYPNKWIGLEQGPNHAVGYEDFVFASVDSLGRLMSTRAMKYENRRFGCIVADEAHHVSEDSTWDNILNYMGVGSDASAHYRLENGLKPLSLFLTATPYRMDGDGFAPFIDAIAANYDILYGIREGWLVDIVARRAHADGFEELEQDEQVDYMVKTYEEYMAGKKTICFARSVNQSRLFADTLNHHGIANAGHVEAGTDDDVRDQINADFKSGELDVLSNRLIYTEGWDAPSLEAMLDNGPTESKARHIQKIGRGLRPAPDAEVDAQPDADARREAIKHSSKPSFLYIPTFDPTDKGMSVSAAITGVEIDTEGKRLVEEVVDVIELIEDEHPEREIRDVSSISELEVRLQAVDVWSQTIENDALKAFTDLRWVVTDGEAAIYLPSHPDPSSTYEDTAVIYRLVETGEGDKCRLQEIIVGGWVEELKHAVKAKTKDHGTFSSIQRGVSLLDKRLKEKTPALYREAQRGGSAPATERQKDYLRREGISFGQDLTMESADLLMDDFRIRRKLDKLDLV